MTINSTKLVVVKEVMLFKHKIKNYSYVLVNIFIIFSLNSRVTAQLNNLIGRDYKQILLVLGRQFKQKDNDSYYDDKRCFWLNLFATWANVVSLYNLFYEICLLQRAIVMD
jgi:hypothetical protein